MEEDLTQLRLKQLLQPFENQNIGITNTTAATPYINTTDILNQYNIPNLQNRDLVEQIILENQLKANPFVRPNILDIAGAIVPGGINQTTPIQNLGIDTSYGVASEPDVKQVESLTETEPSGIAKLLQYLPFGEKSIIGRLIRALPKESPEIRSMKNFYRSQYGLTPTGQVASGIMAGYNPVYGGALNMLTGGRFGKPTQFGLARAARQRIENIAKRKAPQTESSLAKIRELQKFAEADTISRARQAASDVYSRAERAGTLGPGGGFSTSGKTGAFDSKSPRGRQDF